MSTCKQLVRDFHFETDYALAELTFAFYLGFFFFWEIEEFLKAVSFCGGWFRFGEVTDLDLFNLHDACGVMSLCVSV